MALTGAQKIQILRIMGWPHGTLNTASLDYSKQIVDRLTLADADVEAAVIELLGWIDETETQLDAKVAQGGVKKIDDIEFFDDGLKMLKSEKNRLVGELASLLGIPILRRVNMGNVVVA